MATLAGAAGLSAFADTEKKTVTWRVQGFTCITCAVGLDTLLEREKGVVSTRSSYPEAKTTIVFHPEVVTEDALKATIAEMGFHAE
jgi:Cu+-exporting ATPase